MTDPTAVVKAVRARLADGNVYREDLVDLLALVEALQRELGRTRPVNITIENLQQHAAALGRYLEDHTGDDWYARLMDAAQAIVEETA